MKDFTARFIAPLASVRPRGGRLIEGFSEQGEGISGIGLVAPNVGANVLGWQQGHLNTAGAQLTSEVMRRSASFHDHAINGAVNKEALELSAAQATVFNRTP